VYVRSIDPVFAARAETVTISAPLWWVLLGVLPALLLAGVGLWSRGDRRAVIGAGGLLILLAVFQAGGNYRMDAVWASIPVFLTFLCLAFALCWFYKPSSPIYGLLFAWILIGVIALYYPGLFQRKLAMALALPIGISAALGVCSLQRFQKPAYAYLVIPLLLGATNMFWLAREAGMATRNTSNTTMQRVFWPDEVGEFLRYFNNRDNSNDAIIAMPGVAVPNDFDNPTDYMIAIPDLNPVISGWGGIKSYAGHWSETPGYLEKRQRVVNDIFSPNATASSVYELMQEAKATYILAPTSEIASQAGVPPRDFYTGMGEVIYEGDEFVLVRFRPSP
jgi:arabinosyltransferase C